MYTGLDISAAIVAAIMILSPMALGATHASEHMHTATVGNPVTTQPAN